MIQRNLFHVLGLHMHQPPGNLKLLIESNEWEAEQIIRCYERVARYALRYLDVGCLHVGFSGVLLEQFQDPKIVDRYRHLVDIPEMLNNYAEAKNIELIGMGYYHPIFPLIPVEDWADQLLSGRQIMAEIFGREPEGFWPPEMAFSMDMIPALVKAGYTYVVVDGVHVRAEDGIEDIYQPYRACYDGLCLTVVPRDRNLSNAQESGLDPAWFVNEARTSTYHSPRPQDNRLITTWSDGENGGWFRQTHEESGFFGHYFAPYMEHVRSGDFPITPVNLTAYLQEHEATAKAEVKTGAWNVGSTSGEDLRQWAGSERQQRAVKAVQQLSHDYHQVAQQAAKLAGSGKKQLAQVHQLLLEAETSCFLFWGDDWLPQLDERLNPAQELLNQVKTNLQRAEAGETVQEKPVEPTPSAPKTPAVKKPAPTVQSAKPKATEQHLDTFPSVKDNEQRPDQEPMKTVAPAVEHHAETEQEATAQAEVAKQQPNKTQADEAKEAAVQQPKPTPNKVKPAKQAPKAETNTATSKAQAAETKKADAPDPKPTAPKPASSKPPAKTALSARKTSAKTSSARKTTKKAAVSRKTKKTTAKKTR